jgi:hypothetical protein
MRKHFQELFGTAIGGVTGWLSSGVYHDWIQPVLLSAICALVGLIITHYGKKVIKRFGL